MVIRDHITVFKDRVEKLNKVETQQMSHEINQGNYF